MTDTERINFLTEKMAGSRVVASASRSNGLFRLHAVSGATKGSFDVREEIDRAIERDRRRKLGLKR